MLTDTNFMWSTLINMINVLNVSIHLLEFCGKLAIYHTNQPKTLSYLTYFLFDRRGCSRGSSLR